MKNKDWKQLDEEEMLTVNGGETPPHGSLAGLFGKIFKKLFG